jgi:hypothetical protein
VPLHEGDQVYPSQDPIPYYIDHKSIPESAHGHGNDQKLSDILLNDIIHRQKVEADRLFRLTWPPFLPAIGLPELFAPLDRLLFGAVLLGLLLPYFPAWHYNEPKPPFELRDALSGTFDSPQADNPATSPQLAFVPAKP